MRIDWMQATREAIRGRDKAETEFQKLGAVFLALEDERNRYRDGLAQFRAAVLDIQLAEPAYRMMFTDEILCSHGIDPEDLTLKDAAE